MDGVCEPVRCGLARGCKCEREIDEVLVWGEALQLKRSFGLELGTWGVRRACEVRFRA
jgi:hypothetical protein